MSTPAYFIEQFTDPGLGNSSYLIGSNETNLAVLIDPLRDIDHYLVAATRNGVNIVSILETHLHADFVSGAREVANHTGAVIGASLEAELGFDHQPLVEDDELPMGPFTIRVLETPGHSPEHLSFLVTAADGQTPSALFSGGALTVGGAARTDLLGPDQAVQLARQLYETLHTKILTLPDDLKIYPTHGAGSFCTSGSASTERTTTLGHERQNNPLVQAPDKNTFVERALSNLSSYPFYYRYLRGLNQRGPELLGGLPGLQPLSAGEVNAFSDRGGILVLDVRSHEAFAKGHIPMAYGIQTDAPLSTWAGWLIPFNAPLVLVADTVEERVEATRHLMRIGYDDLRGYLEGGLESWAAAGYKIETVATLPVAELHNRLHASDKLAVLDVRQQSEWQAGHIPNALHVENGRLPYDDLALPTDRPLAVMCSTGVRSMAGISVLRRRGYNNLVQVVGGFEAWQKAGYEVEP
jgi:hydroxyacylglutathione hydrolase